MLAHALAALIITFNPGGDVDRFAYIVTRTERPVRIEGTCASACTMYLGARDVCVAPWARFMFHQAYTGRDERHARPSRSGTREMESFLPPRVDAFVHGRLPAPPGQLWLTGTELIHLGVRECS